MKEYKEDTSAIYEDLVGYVSTENVKKDLSSFLGEESDEYKIPIEENKKAPSKEFPESWQTMSLHFDTEKDYLAFLAAAGEKPTPRLNRFTYKAGREDPGLLSFLED